MNVDLLFDPLFRLPFVTGAVLAMLLGVVGVFLRLRKEWLSALGFSQLASCGALAASIAGLPWLLGGMVFGLAGIAFKNVTRSSGSSPLVMMFIAGWAGTVMLSANHPEAEQVGHALLDGQLYFTEVGHLVAALLLGIPGLALLRQFSHWLLIERLFPDFFRSRGMSEVRHRFLFDALACALVVLGTISLGVMANFALFFVPPMIAFRLAAHWRQALALSAVLALLAHSGGFALALVYDQPYGPVCALVLLAMSLVSLAVRPRG